MTNHIKNVKFLLFATTCLLAVCVFDFFIPPDIVVGILYLAAILLVMQESKKIILSFLVIASLMNMANFIYFAMHTSSLYWVYMINSIIVMFGMCTTTIIILKYKKAQDLLTVIDNKNQEKIKSPTAKLHQKQKRNGPS